MKLKNILLLSTLAALSTACSNDNIDGELPLTGAANEIQLVIGGNDESVEYTKAIASDSENKIENLDVYIFASDADGGTYKYLDTWKSAATNDKVLKTFAMQSAGSAWNASVFPEEVSGYPFLKLYLVANREDGLYQENGTATQTLTAFTGAGDFATATDEATFLQSFTKALTADQILHPSLLMTGNGATKMLGTVSKVNIELKRTVARFDIDNTARTSNLTIETIALKQGRKTGPLWPAGTMTTVAEGDLPTSPLLTAYKEVDYTTLANANLGVTESAIYTYPTLSTDKVELIITGKYYDPVSNTDKAATYTVPLQKTDDATGTTSPIAIQRNNRYKLRIIDVTSTTMAAVFEIEDWTSGGGISFQPEAPSTTFEFTATGAAEVEGDKIRVDLDGGAFTLIASYPGTNITIGTTPEYEEVYGGSGWLSIPERTKADNAEKVITVAPNDNINTEQRPWEVHIGYITVKWGDTPEEQKKLEVYRGSSLVTYLDKRVNQTVRFAAIKMKDDKYWAPINVGATTANNKAVATANTDITADCGKLFQWGRLYGLAATNDATTCSNDANLGSLGRPVQGDLENMSLWDGIFITTTPLLDYSWLQINGEGNANPTYSEMEKDAWYQQLWNANEGKDNADVVKTAADPCPTGWRVPTQADWYAIGANLEPYETGTTWDAINLRLIFPGKEKDLLLPVAGNRHCDTGASQDQGDTGYYWSSSIPSNGFGAYATDVTNIGKTYASSSARGNSCSVRCIQE